MTTDSRYVGATLPTVRNRTLPGFWPAFLTAGASALALAIGVNTTPRAGPFCQVDPCIAYPYTDAAAYVPNDYLWIYPAFFVGPLFVILVACIHHYASSEGKIFSQIALSFAVISATALATNYFIQLRVIQPSIVKGELEGLSLFTQNNPHGIFIALEDLGYLMMSVAFLFIAPVFIGHSRLERAIRWLYAGSSILAFGAFAILGLLYGHNLEYRFEVTVLVINWSTLIVTGILLGVFFRRPLAEVL